MANFFDLLEKKKNDDNILFIYSNRQTCNNESKNYNVLLDEKKLLDTIRKSNLDQLKKGFFIKQILNRKEALEFVDECKEEIEFSFSKLYNLVQIKIKFILENPLPYNEFYPIITGKIPAIDDIALFIACLKLGKKPLVFDFEKIDISNVKIENELKNKNGFYILSSGSTGHPKIKSVVEEEFLSEKNVKRNSMICNGDMLCQSPLYGISGLVIVFINTLIKNNKVYFEQSYEYNSLKPVFDELNGDGIQFYDTINNYIIGKYNSPDLIKKRLIHYKKKFKIKDDILYKKNYYGYGQTESNGIISLNNLEDAEVIVVDALDILTFNYKIKSIKFFEKNIFRKNVFKLNHIQKKYPISYLSVGKVDESITIENNKKIGEILVDGKETGDIGCIVNGYLYFLCRKNDKLNIFKNYIEYTYNLTPVFDDKREKFVIDLYYLDTKKIINFLKLKKEMPKIKKDLGLDINLIPLFISTTKSPGLSKCMDNGQKIRNINVDESILGIDDFFVESSELTRIYFYFSKILQYIGIDISNLDDNSKVFKNNYLFRMIKEKSKNSPFFEDLSYYEDLSILSAISYLYGWHDEYLDFAKKTKNIIKVDLNLLKYLTLFTNISSILNSFIEREKLLVINYNFNKEEEYEHKL